MPANPISPVMHRPITMALAPDSIVLMSGLLYPVWRLVIIATGFSQEFFELAPSPAQGFS